MAIYRGVGGTGESSSDSTINATTALAAASAASAAAALASELAAETAETNAASSASSASSSATSASSSASAASTSASNAASSEAGASSSASSASTSATNAAASESAVAASASSASSSASNASTSASTATTKASEASTSATNAASSASAASTSATNAASSASTASTAATTATTKASEASTSASNAATSATNAASSAAAAASALDSFDDRYLGTKTSDPTLDNDGNALATGALYFNTTANVMKVYDGSAWIAASSASSASMARFRYVATSGQTTFSGADSASATLTYTVNNIAVHRNGVTLDTSEYTASNGTSIVLNVAAGTGDIVDIIAFKSFTVADALSTISGGTVNGGVNITGNVGIGTSSPSAPTTVKARSADGIALRILAPSTTTSYSAIQFTNDPVTAEYSSILGDTSSNLIFRNNASERMRIDASGNVGIGTTSTGTFGKFAVAGSDDAALLGLSSVTGVLRARAYNTATTGAIVESTNASQSAYANLFLNGLNLLLGTGNTERMRIDSSGNIQVQAGAIMPYAPTPTSIAAATTLTNAQIQAQIINTTGTTYTVTMPLGSTLETLAPWATTNIAYDFFVINTASGTITIGANSNTTLGSLTIATGVSAQFRIRRTAANTFTIYRLG